jgi:hypothetical protein
VAQGGRPWHPAARAALPGCCFNHRTPRLWVTHVLAWCMGLLGACCRQPLAPPAPLDLRPWLWRAASLAQAAAPWLPRLQLHRARSAGTAIVLKFQFWGLPAELRERGWEGRRVAEQLSLQLTVQSTPCSPSVLPPHTQLHARALSWVLTAAEGLASRLLAALASRASSNPQSQPGGLRLLEPTPAHCSPLPCRVGEVEVPATGTIALLKRMVWYRSNMRLPPNRQRLYTLNSEWATPQEYVWACEPPHLLWKPARHAHCLTLPPVQPA